MSFRSGYPLSHFLPLGIKDLDRCSRELLSAGNVGLADLYLGLGVLHQKDCITFCICGRAAGGRHCAVRSDEEGRIRCYCVSIRCHCLAQRISHSGLQAGDNMCLLARIPFDHRFVVFYDLDMRAGNFRSVRYIRLADADLCHGIFDKKLSFLDRSSCLLRIDSSLCIQNKCCIRCDQIAFGCYCLMKRIGDARCQAFHYVRLFRRIPLPDNVSVRIQDLDVSTFELFFTRNVCLADFDLGQGICDQKDRISFFIRGRSTCGRNCAIRSNRKCCICHDCVAIRRCCLTKRILHSGLQAFDLVRLRSGYPLRCFIAIGIKNLDRRSRKFLSARNISLADLDLGLGICDQKDRISFFIGSLSTCCRHGAVRSNRKCCICHDCVAVRRCCLTKRILHSGLQAFNLVRLRSGYPLRCFHTIGIKDLDRRSLELLSVGNIRLADLDLGLGILHQNDGISKFVRCCFRLRCDSSVCRNGKRDIGSNGITFRCHCLAHGVRTGRKVFDHVCLVAGGPLINLFTGFVQDLNGCPGEFLFAGNFSLTEADRFLGILHQKDSVSVFIGGLIACGRHGSVRGNRERRLCRDQVAGRRHCLFQCVCLTCCEAFHNVCFRSGFPLGKHCTLGIQNLDRSSCELLACGNIGLADLDLGLGIFHQKDSISFIIGGLTACGRHGSVRGNRERRLCRDQVAGRRHCLFQCVCLTCCEAFHNVCFRSGFPLGKHCTLGIQNLDRSSCELLACGNIGLADLNRLCSLDSLVVCKGSGLYFRLCAGFDHDLYIVVADQFDSLLFKAICHLTDNVGACLEIGNCDGIRLAVLDRNIYFNRLCGGICFCACVRFLCHCEAVGSVRRRFICGLIGNRFPVDRYVFLDLQRSFGQIYRFIGE